MTSPRVAPADLYRGFAISLRNGQYSAERVDGASGRVLTALTRSRIQSEIDGFLDDANGLALMLDPADAESCFAHGVDANRTVSLTPVAEIGRLALVDEALAGLSLETPGAGERLRASGIDRLIVSAAEPSRWLAARPEARALSLGLALEVVFPDARRVYRAHDLGRLMYLKAYLQPMLAATGRLDGLRLLEIGCSDGLTCDLLMRFGAGSVVGIDTLADVGARYQTDGAIAYHRMDGERTVFEDSSFDVVYSIATLEHVAAPEAAMREMLRVVRPGGVVYAQAGPLYLSPFGHHMFGHFDDYPWIHVRLTPEQIVEEGARRGLHDRLRVERGLTCEQYVSGMLSRKHVNGLRLDEYGIGAIRREASEVLLWEPSYEGRNLLTEEIASELAHIPRHVLTEHGFQLAVRR